MGASNRFGRAAAVMACVAAGLTAVATQLGATPAGADTAGTGPGQVPSWQSQATYPLPAGGLSAVSCGSTTTCVAVSDLDAERTVDGGASWTTVPLPAGAQAVAISCPSALDCVAVGGSSVTGTTAYATGDGGLTWASHPLGIYDGDMTGVSCSSTAYCLAIGAIAATPSSVPVIWSSADGGGSWTQLSVAFPAAEYPTSVTCVASSAFCLVGGYQSHSLAPSTAFFIATADGGRTWSQWTAPTALETVTSESCPDQSHCWVVGVYSDRATPHPGVFATADTGATWTQQGPLQIELPLTAVACVDDLDCATNGLDYTHDGGTTWATGTGPVTEYQYGAVSCGAPAFCVAVGDTIGGQPENLDALAAVSTDGGATWTAAQLPGGPRQITALACASSQQCWAGGSDTYDGEVGTIQMTRDGGGTWTAQTLPTDFGQLTSLSCPDSTDCWAASSYPWGGIVATKDGGATWKVQSSTYGYDWSAVACPDSTHCLAVGWYYPSNAETGIAMSTSDGGATWTTLAVPAGISALDAVTCTTDQDCWAVGDPNPFSGGPEVVSTTDGGATWTPETLPGGAADLTAITCVSDMACWVAGTLASDSTGVIAATTDGGSTWVPEPVPAGIVSFTSAACPDATHCWAVASTPGGSAILGTADGGATWQTEGLQQGVGVLSALVCTSPGVCLAGGRTAAAGGVILARSLVSPDPAATSWAAQPVPPGTYSLDGISCPTTEVCRTVGEASTSRRPVGVALETANGGATWTQDHVPAGTPALTGISCTTDSSCITAGGNAALATSDGGSTWSSASLTAGTSLSNFAAESISCPTAMMCMIAGQHSSYGTAGEAAAMVTSDGGSTWLMSGQYGGTTSSSGVSCPAADACYTTIVNGTLGGIRFSADGGHTWVGGGFYPMRAISCPTLLDCAAVGDTGIAVTTDGGVHWSGKAFPGNVAHLGAVACPTATVCWAAGTDPSGGPVLLGTTNGGDTWSSVPLAAGVASLSAVTCDSVTNCWAVGTSIDGSGLILTTSPTIEHVEPAHGPAGTEVTLAGINLAGATAVSFGGVGAPIVYNTAYQVRTTVPAGAGAGYITVSTPLGTAISPIEFDDVPQTISFDPPPTGTVGTSATLSATGGGSGNPVVLSVDPASSPGACTLTGTDGTNVHYASAGTCVIDANQAGSGEYAAAAPVQGRISVVVPPPPCPAGPGPALPDATGIASVSISDCPGYDVVDSAGRVSAFGSAAWHGDLASRRLSAPIIAIDTTPDGGGYWLLGADGGVFAFGNARFFGSTGGMRLNAPVVAMAVTADNGGYWIIAKDGGVFSFGDARFHGSTGNLKLASPVVGMAVAPGGSGYWLVAGDGGVFDFSRDGFFGSLASLRLAAPIVGMSSTPDGRGYTLVGSDGGVFSFGDAPFYGSVARTSLPAPIVDLSPAPADDGYYLVDRSGRVYAFGPGARYLGSV